MARSEARYREAERRLWDSVGVSPTERRIALPRTGVTVRVQEVGEGAPVVFVHGASNGGSSWAPLVARLPGYRCILLDRPGCGLSDRLATRFEDTSQLATFGEGLIVDVMDALGLESANVVATSFGGYIGLRTVAGHPERVSRLVLMGWPLGAPVAKLPAVMRLGMVPGLGSLIASVPPNARAVRMMFRQIGLGQALDAGRISQEALDWYLSLLRETPTMRNELTAGPRIIHPLRGMNREILLPESLLSSITTPVGFLWGDGDPYGTTEIARAFVGHFPNAELRMMAGAGHAVWLDNPDVAAEFTRGFLGGSA